MQVLIEHPKTHELAHARVRWIVMHEVHPARLFSLHC